MASPKNTEGARPRVLILGDGFAGVGAAQDVQITVESS